MDAIAQFPHCDSLVLHAPGECKYCDGHPDWQQLREMWGVNFTGHHDIAKATCPAERHRPLERINNWGGNVALTGAHPFLTATSHFAWSSAAASSHVQVAVVARRPWWRRLVGRGY